jgi:putative holliday junction resolvase
LRTLAVDFGARRFGIALSDAGGRFATPIEVLSVSDPARAIAPVLELIRKEGVERVVVGLPLNMDGSFGPAAKTVTAWSAALELSAAKAGMPVKIVHVDERLSSFEAEQRLTNRKKAGEKLTRKGKKRQLDAVAAAMFLQDFLDGKLAEIETDAR